MNELDPAQIVAANPEAADAVAASLRLIIAQLEEMRDQAAMMLDTLTGLTGVIR
jgi:hypothetical protein